MIDAKKHFVTDEEREWISNAQQGDQTAFHQLYLRYHRKVYALCVRMLANTESAEDVCQEVFVQVWQKLANFRGESKFSTWLHSVATNIVLGHIRKNKTWLQRVFSVEDNPNEEQVATAQANELVNITELDQHIMKLPERARLVFVLFAVEGYRHEEIADMLKMAVGSSKAQYHRARTLLKEWVEHD